MMKKTLAILFLGLVSASPLSALQTVQVGPSADNGTTSYPPVTATNVLAIDGITAASATQTLSNRAVTSQVFGVVETSPGVFAESQLISGSNEYAVLSQVSMGMVNGKATNFVSYVRAPSSISDTNELVVKYYDPDTKSYLPSDGIVISGDFKQVSNYYILAVPDFNNQLQFIVSGIDNSLAEKAIVEAIVYDNGTIHQKLLVPAGQTVDPATVQLAPPTQKSTTGTSYVAMVGLIDNGSTNVMRLKSVWYDWNTDAFTDAAQDLPLLENRADVFQIFGDSKDNCGVLLAQSEGGLNGKVYYCNQVKAALNPLTTISDPTASAYAPVAALAQNTTDSSSQDLNVLLYSEKSGVRILTTKKILLFNNLLDPLVQVTKPGEVPFRELYAIGGSSDSPNLCLTYVDAQNISQLNLYGNYNLGSGWDTSRTEPIAPTVRANPVMDMRNGVAAIGYTQILPDINGEGAFSVAVHGTTTTPVFRLSSHYGTTSNPFLANSGKSVTLASSGLGAFSFDQAPTPLLRTAFTLNTTLNATPAAPTNFRGSQVKVRYLKQSAFVNRFSWDPSTDPVDHYNVYRSREDENWEFLGSVDARSPLVFIDPSQTSGQKTIYKITSVAAGNESYPDSASGIIYPIF